MVTTQNSDSFHQQEMQYFLVQKKKKKKKNAISTTLLLATNHLNKMENIEFFYNYKSFLNLCYITPSSKTWRNF